MVVETGGVALASLGANKDVTVSVVVATSRGTNEDVVAAGCGGGASISTQVQVVTTTGVASTGTKTNEDVVGAKVVAESSTTTNEGVVTTCGIATTSTTTSKEVVGT